MTKKRISGGVVHTVPVDLEKVLVAPRILALWESLTPLARNEWICWVTSVKKDATRKEHVRRLKEDLLHGKRRPCCWAGCIHREDKSLNASQKFILRKSSKVY